MSYTLLVGGHNCIIAGDFIKKGGCYCRKRGRLLSQKGEVTVAQKKFFGLTMRFFRGQFFYNYYNYYNYYERDVTADT